MMKRIIASIVLLVSTSLFSPVLAESGGKNITADFTNTDAVIFTPKNAWTNQALSPACGSSFQNRTEYATSLTSSLLQLEFAGTAVYVFGIRSNLSGLASFQLDQKNTFTNLGAPSLSCDVPLFSADDLSNTQHELNITLFGSSQNGNGSTDATLEITQIIYTQDGNAVGSPGSRKSKVAPIVGGVVGGVVAVLLLAVGYVWYRKKTNRQYRLSDSHVKPVEQLAIEPREAELSRKLTMTQPKVVPYTLSPVSESGASGSDDDRRRPSFSITEDGETTVGDRPQYQSRRTFSSGDSSISKGRPLSPISSGSLYPFNSMDAASGSGSQHDGVAMSDLVDRVAQAVAARVMGGASTQNLAGSSSVQGDLEVEPPPEYVERNTEQEVEEGTLSPPVDRKGR